MPLESLSDRGPGFNSDLVDYLCSKLKIRHNYSTPYYPQCNYSTPLESLSDRGPGFNSDLVDYLCSKLKIRHNYSTPYYPQCNGLNGQLNGDIIRMLTKTIGHHGRNWDLELPCGLWAYRIAVKIGTGFFPFHMVFGKQALLPLEVEIPSIKMLVKYIDEDPDYYQERLLFLVHVQLDRLTAFEYYMKMQEKNMQRVNEQFKDKGILKGDLVLRYNSKLDKTFQQKFQINWEGPSRR